MKKPFKVAALINLMNYKGYPYFEGLTNKEFDGFYVTFSQHRVGRGNAVELRISNDDSNDIQIWANTSYLMVEEKDISDYRIFKLINEHCK